MEREALKLALEKIERFITKQGYFDDFADEITAIKEALAQPAQEPIDWEQIYWDMVNAMLRDKLRAQPAQELAIGDIRALKHRIHELEGEVIGYKRILDAQPEQEPIGNSYLLADKVREALDRKACPDAFMRIAYESIIKNYTTTPPQPEQKSNT